MPTVGNIHSIETCGTVDGPGIRFVIFMQGCPLRCQYCHNPDTWKAGEGRQMTVPELMAEAVKYKSYMKFSGGGVTISGGEPLMQPDFLLELVNALKKEEIHVAIDTSGYIISDKAKEVLKLADLVLLDVKHANPDQYRVITGVELDPTLETLAYLDELAVPVWARYVLVPGLSDQAQAIENLAILLSRHSNIQRVEVLPFHKMGEYKWAELGLAYQLTDVSEPDQVLVDNAREILKSHGLNVAAG